MARLDVCRQIRGKFFFGGTLWWLVSSITFSPFTLLLLRLTIIKINPYDMNIKTLIPNSDEGGLAPIRSQKLSVINLAANPEQRISFASKLAEIYDTELEKYLPCTAGHRPFTVVQNCRKKKEKKIIETILTKARNQEGTIPPKEPRKNEVDVNT